MNRSGTLAYAHNFSTTYTRPDTGEYCLEPTGGVSASTSPIAITTAEYGFSHGSGDLLAVPFKEAPDCATGDYEVQTFLAGKESNEVAFYITIPG